MYKLPAAQVICFRKLQYLSIYFAHNLFFCIFRLCRIKENVKKNVILIVMYRTARARLVPAEGVKCGLVLSHPRCSTLVIKGANPVFRISKEVCEVLFVPAADVNLFGETWLVNPL